MENMDSPTPDVKIENCSDKEDFFPDPEPEFILGDVLDTDNTPKREFDFDKKNLDKKLLADCIVSIERCDKHILYPQDPETQPDDKSLLQELVAFVQPESNQESSNENPSAMQDLDETSIKEEPREEADDLSGADDNPVSGDGTAPSTRISNGNMRSRSQLKQKYILETQIVEINETDDDYFENVVESNDFNNYEADGNKIIAHTDDIFCKCMHCNEIFNRNQAMQTQKSRKQKSKLRTKYNFKCYLCHKVFDRPSRLKAHVDSKCKKLKLFGCNFCFKGFLTKSQLKQHLIYTHHTEKRNEYKCYICDKSFLKKTVLKVHIKAVHEKHIIPTQVKCKFCNKTYRNNKSVQAHIGRMHKVEEEQYECAYCGKIYGYRGLLTNHIQKHMGLRSFRCSICLRYFKTESEFEFHMAAKSCSSKNYVCDICGKIWNRKTALEMHKLIHSDEKPYVCGNCGKCFRTEGNLAQHSVTHSDVRPYKCDKCDKAFRIRNHLRQHMAVHGLASSTNYRKRNWKTSLLSLNSGGDLILASSNLL